MIGILITMSMGRLREEFIRHLEAEGCSPKTVRAYSDALKRFEAWLQREGLSPAEVRGKDWLRFRDFLATEPVRREKGRGRKPKGGTLSPSSINQILSAVRRFYEWATTMDYVPSPPTPRRMGVKQVEADIKPLDAREERALFRWLERRAPCSVAFAFRLMLATGLRVREAANVRIGDILISNGDVKIQIRRKGGSPSPMSSTSPLRGS